MIRLAVALVKISSLGKENKRLKAELADQKCLNVIQTDMLSAMAKRVSHPGQTDDDVIKEVAEEVSKEYDNKISTRLHRMFLLVSDFMGVYREVACHGKERSEL
jgi:hypothetical protein